MDNPECHGEFLVELVVNEIVKSGKMQCSCVAIVKPNTHPSELQYLKAEASGSTITITSLAHKKSYLTEKKQWMKALTDNKEFLQAGALVTAMTSLCTRLAKGREPKRAADDQNPVRPVLKKTIIDFAAAGIAFDKEYFAASDGTLELLPLPCEHKSTLHGKSYIYSECTVIWRAYIKYSASSVLEEKAQADGNSHAMELLGKLMSGSKIT